MDPLGVLQPITIKPLPVPGSRSVAPVLPPPSSGAPTESVQVALPLGFDSKAADQARLETLKKIAGDIANVFIVGDRTFTIFKDVTGQYITRFTSLRDGRVTYIPEPELIKQNRSNAGAALNIKV